VGEKPVFAARGDVARVLDLGLGSFGDVTTSSQGGSPSRPQVAPAPHRSVAGVQASWPRTRPRPCAVAAPQPPHPQTWATRQPPLKEAPPSRPQSGGPVSASYSTTSPSNRPNSTGQRLSGSAPACARPFSFIARPALVARGTRACSQACLQWVRPIGVVEMGAV